MKFSSSGSWNKTYTVTFSDGTTANATNSNPNLEYDVYLIYESNNVAKASSTIPVGSTTSINIDDISNLDATDLVGFTWVSNNPSIASVTVDGATGIPTVKAVKIGTTIIVGTRTINNVTETIKWNITVENKLTSQIIFEHQLQDNNDFKNQNSYRPYSEYGYGSTEATNVIKFIVVLADENGKLTMYGSNPDVTLPEGSIVPDSYVFDLGEDKTLTITENTFEGISAGVFVGCSSIFVYLNNYFFLEMSCSFNLFSKSSTACAISSTPFLSNTTIKSLRTSINEVAMSLRYKLLRIIRRNII